MGGDVAALDGLMREFRTLDAEAIVDGLDPDCQVILATVYEKFRLRIDRTASYALSVGTLCICIDEGKTDLLGECVKAHRKELYPRRRKAKHVSIEDAEEIAEPPGRVTEDEAVFAALDALDPEDALLLRDRHMGEHRRSTKKP